MTLGNRLKKLLYDNQITQKQLAKDLNIAQSTLNGYVQDYREPDYKILDALASYFGVSADYLLGRTNTVKINNLNNISSDEQELLSIYRCLTEEQKVYLLEQAKIYTNYKKQPRQQ